MDMISGLQASFKSFPCSRAKLDSALCLDRDYADKPLNRRLSSFYSDLDLVLSQVPDLVGFSSCLGGQADKLDVFGAQDDSRGFLVLGKKVDDPADNVGIGDGTEDGCCRSRKRYSGSGSGGSSEEVCSSTGEALVSLHRGSWCFWDRSSRFLRPASEIHDRGKEHGKKFG